jgi:hypothetical protein
MAEREINQHKPPLLENHKRKGNSSFARCVLSKQLILSLICRTSTSPLGQFLQPLTINPHSLPLTHNLRPNTLIKFNTRLIPLQHRPLQPPSLHLHHFLRQFPQQSLSVPTPPKLLANK